MPVSYYDILNVPYTADIEDIKASYRAMAKRYHPDISSSEHASTIFKLIVKAYQTLGNSESKGLYDKKFFKSKLVFEGGRGYIKLPKKRIDYASSLKNMAQSGMLARGQVKRKDRLKSFGYDISLSLTNTENRRGVAIKVPLPVRGTCHACYGMDQSCYLCEGLGFYHSTEDLDFLIPPNTPNNKIFDIDLRKNPPATRFSYFTLSNLKVWIKVLDRP